MRDRELRVPAGFSKRKAPVVVLKLKEDKAETAELTNLSRTGMFARTRRPLPPGTTVEFSLPEGVDGDACIGNAKVRWRREGPEAGVGLQVVEFEKGSEGLWHEILERELRALAVGDFIDTKVELIPHDTSCKKALQTLYKSGLKIALAVDEAGKPVGKFGASELWSELLTPKFLDKPISALASKGFVLVRAEQDLFSLFKFIRNHDVFVVTGKTGKPVGILLADQIVPYWAELMDLQANKIRKNFSRAICAVVHDLTNPLSVIQATTGVLTSQMVTPERFYQEGFATMIEENCEKLQALVEDLLTMTRRGAHLHLRLAEVDLAAVTEAVYRGFKQKADEKGIQFYLENGGRPVPMIGDGKRLERIVSNLVSNAIKYSDKGSKVWLRAAVAESSATIEVEDTGQGIPAHELPELFEEFCQVSPKPTAGEKSTGLGLSIVRSLVQAHGGQITVASELGVGTKFIVTLPVTQKSHREGA